MLRIENLNQYYGGSHTLRDVSIEAPGGAVTAVLGEPPPAASGPRSTAKQTDFAFPRERH